MNKREAQDIIDIIGAATTVREFNARTLELWTGQLLPLNAELATNAALTGIREWRFFPSWAQFHEVYKEERQTRARLVAEEENAEILKRGEKAPEWVYVWMWARQLRAPAEERFLPQQKDWGDPERTMSREEYEALLEEWVQAGRPKLLPSFYAAEVAS